VAPGLDLVVVVTTDWQGLAAAGQVMAVTDSALSVIVDGVIPAVRP
jgi:hypothetical protein